MPSLCVVAILTFGLLAAVLPLHAQSATSRTSPPPGAVVVRAGTDPASGEFARVQAAVDSLPNDNSNQTIFIFPGNYTEQVVISRSGPLTIFGYTNDTTTWLGNTATISFSESLAQSGTDAASATLQVNKHDFNLYNVNLENNFGHASVNGQALAISASGTQQGFYGVSFTSFQDTVLAETGVQFYANSFIEGVTSWTRFLPERHNLDGPSSSDDGIFVINQSNIVLSPNAASGTSGHVFLGRPWTDTARQVFVYSGFTILSNSYIIDVIYNNFKFRVVFSNSVLGSHLNPAGWSIWSTATPNTDHVLFAEFANTGPGAAGAVRANFSTELTSISGFTISDILGSNFASWVDPSYL